MSKNTDIPTYLTSDEQKLWKKSTELAKTRVREPLIDQFYKTKLVQLIPAQSYRYTYIDDDDDTPESVNLEKTQVDAISKYHAEGYSIRIYVHDNQIMAEAAKSYLDTDAYDLAVAEYNRLLPAKEQARKDMDRLKKLMEYRKSISVISSSADPATIAIVARKNLKMQ